MKHGVKETDGGAKLSCGNAVQWYPASEEILSAPSQARLHLLMRVHVSAHKHAHVRSNARAKPSNAKTVRGDVWEWI